MSRQQNGAGGEMSPVQWRNVADRLKWILVTGMWMIFCKKALFFTLFKVMKIFLLNNEILLF